MPSDSQKYTALAQGLKVLLLHSLQAADVVERELTIHTSLSGSASKRLSSEEIERREAYLTEVNSWAVTIPHLLRVSRGIQFHPMVQERMGTLALLIHDQLKLDEEITALRLDILSRSALPGEMLARMTIWELSYIATFEWLKANSPMPNAKVMREPEMLKNHLDSAGILQAQEKEHTNRVGKTEEGGKKLQEDADIARAIEGAERVSQGYPEPSMYSICRKYPCWFGRGYS